MQNGSRSGFFNVRAWSIKKRTGEYLAQRTLDQAERPNAMGKVRLKPARSREFKLTSATRLVPPEA